MKIKYLGPGSFVNVDPYGQHDKNEIKEYPDEFAAELILTSKKQQFAPADAGNETGDNPLNKMTVAELKKMLDDMQVEYPGDAKKADLIELIKAQPEKNEE